MKPRVSMIALIAGLLLATTALAQRPFCINGRCVLPQYQPPNATRFDWQQEPLAEHGSIVLYPLTGEDDLDLQARHVAVHPVDTQDPLQQIVQATVRVTVNNVCGSGTIVGRDGQGNAIVLTNAHVAGTRRGRTVNLQRWNVDGTSERGQGTIIASGYGRGMSVDFALLRCNPEFAPDVTPIPLADRYPQPDVLVTNHGCPRCEWPSLQALQMIRGEGQVLTWKPEAIGGRSGSSVIDHTDVGPRVVGLLTWGGNGQGLGQSTPFLLQAMRGRLPSAIESLPAGVREVAEQTESTIYRVPATVDGREMKVAISARRPLGAQVQQDVIDSITEPTPKPDKDRGLRDRDRQPGDGPVVRGLDWIRRVVITLVLCTACLAIGFLVGKFLKWP